MRNTIYNFFICGQSAIYSPFARHKNCMVKIHNGASILLYDYYTVEMT